jgi:hypothetical protein
MLTGVGLFAAKSASLATRGSGYLRQMTQTHYVTEYAFQLGLAELSTERRQAYLKYMANTPSADCQHDPDPHDGVSPPTTDPLVHNYTCFGFGYTDLEQIVDAPTAGVQELLDSTIVGPPDVPGSLGIGRLAANMRVELSDLAPTEKPVPGMDATGSSGVPMRFYTVSVGTVGQVRHDASAIEAETSASVEYGRGSMMVGPIPTL